QRQAIGLRLHSYTGQLGRVEVKPIGRLSLHAPRKLLEAQVAKVAADGEGWGLLRPGGHTTHQQPGQKPGKRVETRHRKR
nr:hypothetical protein [Tanacetum cinerariifolium]